MKYYNTISLVITRLVFWKQLPLGTKDRKNLVRLSAGFARPSMMSWYDELDIILENIMENI